ncbi:microtubule associated protein-domain-containing protein [Dichomitus squalens]|uniref:Microtubule associated protein-domain-containing protein n=1 Tax=Dichomitus squalens TaxID=114155 RepID=A0A4Q9MLJ4_9APHY|nr:microtubule associated protein-domain-containing protein [Dichomitus squalens]
MSTTITSLLNSLHTHLQSQTQLLPTLHAQLGLPPTALHDELSALQQQLTQCIEGQIELRRKQVDEWMEKCGAVEDQCIRYGKALGGHLKSSGPSVGEIRKEQVLPRRFELVSDYHEKLRQQYHTKLEQLLNLTSRISALANTLGQDFYAADILEPAPAIGENEYDSTSHRDVTPERFSKLEKELVRGKGEVAKRLTQLSAHFVQIDWLYTELGITPPSLDDLPTASSSTFGLPPLPRPGSSCGSRTTGPDPFLSTSMSIPMSTPTPASRLKPLTPLLFLSDDTPQTTEVDHQRVFAKFVARMEELSDEDLPDSNVAVGLEGVEPTPALMAWAEATRADLEETKKRREAHIQAMYDQLEALWRRLGVTDAEMDAFVEAQRGSTDVTIKAYEEELERMLELKRERMGTFIENARTEITKLWDELMVGEEERADFAPFFDDEHTEELLSIHEEEIKRLKEERRMKGPLLHSIKKYFDICDDEKELAASASDQSRLLGRGPRDPGRLLREEKMRKRVTKEKPRLEQDLLMSLPAWEAETGRAFLVHGMSMLQFLMDTVSVSDKENANKRTKGRAGSVPPRATTPANGSNHLAPPTSGHGKSGVVTPAIRPASTLGSSHSAPNKRPRLGEATATHTNRAPLGSSRGPSVNRAASPTKIPLPGKTPTTAAGSSLPRPVSIAMPVPKPGTAHHALGHGRVPSAQQLGSSHSYGMYQPGHRAASYMSSSTSSSSMYASGTGRYGAPAPSAAAVAKKASRARRESFKPRPSVDEDWAADVGLGGRRWAGFAGAVKEEDEEY